MKRLKKSTGITLALLVYVSLTAAYFLPRNSEITTCDKWFAAGAAYLVVLLVWQLMRYKERKNKN